MARKIIWTAEELKKAEELGEAKAKACPNSAPTLTDEFKEILFSRVCEMSKALPLMQAWMRGVRKVRTDL